MSILLILLFLFVQPDHPQKCEEGFIIFYSSGSGNGDLLIYDPVSSELKPFAASEGTEGAPVFHSFTHTVKYRLLDNDTDLIMQKVFPDGNEEQVFMNPATDEVPSWSPVENAIVYSRTNPDNSFSLVTRDLENDRETVLIDNAASDFYPSWSPDGSEILIEFSDSTNSSGLAIIARDGSGFRKLTTDSKLYGHPRWSPDGKSIIYYIYEGGQADLFKMDLETLKTNQLTDTPTNELIAEFSPSGDKIVYGGIAEDDWEVFIKDLDSGKITRVSYSKGFDGAPIWVPCNTK